MAKFSGNIYCDLDKEGQKEEIVKVLPMLQEMMSTSDFIKIRRDYHNSNTDIPFWKFVFDNILQNETESLFGEGCIE